jgi:hypothetical protein
MPIRPPEAIRLRSLRRRFSDVEEFNPTKPTAF